MPHPRKHMKLTGDSHPPELEDDPGTERAGADTGTPAAATTAAPRAAEAPTGEDERYLWVAMPARQYVDAARAQVRDRPLTTAAAAFFAGFMLAVVTRSR